MSIRLIYRQTGQRGFAFLPVVLTLLMAGVLALSAQWLNILKVKGAQAGDTPAKMEAVRKALVQFVAINGRLPCPSAGTLDTGVASAVQANGNCATRFGVVPWQALGLTLEDTLDGWGNKLSYVIYDGQTGAAQNNGLNFTACDIAPITNNPAPLAPLRQCQASAPRTSGHPSDPNGVLSVTFRPGLTVRDYTQTVNFPPQGDVRQAAFVLISHGESGAGAWLRGGARTPLPPAGNVNERGNTQLGTTYYLAAKTGANITLQDVTHFDDFLVYMTLPDLARAASRMARRYTLPNSLSGTQGDALNNALTNNGVVSFSGNSAQTALIIVPTPPGMTTTPLLLSTAANAVLARNSSGTGLGVCSASNLASPQRCDDNNARLEAGEYLSIMTPTIKSKRFAMQTLLPQLAPPNNTFQLDFNLQGVFKGSISYPPTPPGVAAYVFPDLYPPAVAPALPMSVEFDEIVIRPTGGTKFLVEKFRLCDGDTVATPNCTP